MSSSRSDRQTSRRPKFPKLGSIGLIIEDYVRNEHGAGGLYERMGKPRAAEAWFTEAKAEYTTLFGARPTLTWYEANLTVDNKAGQTRVNGQPVGRGPDELPPLRGCAHSRGCFSLPLAGGCRTHAGRRDPISV